MTNYKLQQKNLKEIKAAVLIKIRSLQPLVLGSDDIKYICGKMKSVKDHY